MSEFVSAPPPSSGVPWESLQGHLLIIEPHSYETGVSTVHGEKDAVRADIYALTGPDTAEEFTDALVFGLVLLGQLRNNIGKKVVGRLTRGAATAGKNAPWLLDAATPEDIEKAQAYLTKTTLTAAAPPF